MPTIYKIVFMQILFLPLFALASDLKWSDCIRFVFLGIAFLLQGILAFMLFHPSRSNLKDKANGK